MSQVWLGIAVIRVVVASLSMMWAYAYASGSGLSAWGCAVCCVGGGGAVGTAFVTGGVVGGIGAGSLVAAVWAVRSRRALDVVLMSQRVM